MLIVPEGTLATFLRHGWLSSVSHAGQPAVDPRYAASAPPNQAFTPESTRPSRTSTIRSKLTVSSSHRS